MSELAQGRSGGSIGSSGGSLVATPDCGSACSPGFESSNLPSLQWTAGPYMGCHQGGHFAVGCPLRGGRGEYKKIGTYVPPKNLRKNKGERSILI